MPGCATSHQRNLLFEGDLKLKEGTASKVSKILQEEEKGLTLCLKKKHESDFLVGLK